MTLTGKQAAIVRYAILPHEQASLGDAAREYDTLAEARADAKPGEAIVALKYEFSDSELIEVIEEHLPPEPADGRCAGVLGKVAALFPGPCTVDVRTAKDGSTTVAVGNFPNDFDLTFEALASLADLLGTRAINIEHEGTRVYDSCSTSASTEIVARKVTVALDA